MNAKQCSVDTTARAIVMVLHNAPALHQGVHRGNAFRW